MVTPKTDPTDVGPDTYRGQAPRTSFGPFPARDPGGSIVQSYMLRPDYAPRWTDRFNICYRYPSQRLHTLWVDYRNQRGLRPLGQVAEVPNQTGTQTIVLRKAPPQNTATVVLRRATTTDPQSVPAESEFWPLKQILFKIEDYLRDPEFIVRWGHGEHPLQYVKLSDLLEISGEGSTGGVLLKLFNQLFADFNEWLANVNPDEIESKRKEALAMVINLGEFTASFICGRWIGLLMFYVYLQNPN